MYDMLNMFHGKELMLLHKCHKHAINLSYKVVQINIIPLCPFLFFGFKLQI